MRDDKKFNALPTSRRIHPNEFNEAKTTEARWLLAYQLASNISRIHRTDFREDLIGVAAADCVRVWDRWKPEQGNGFRYFTQVAINSMRQQMRTQYNYSKHFSLLGDEYWEMT